MNPHKKEFWFPRKRFGMGWGLPVTWQGWVVFLGYILLSILGIRLFSDDSGEMSTPWFLLYFSVLTVAFIFVVWKKGEPPER